MDVAGTCMRVHADMCDLLVRPYNAASCMCMCMRMCMCMCACTHDIRMRVRVRVRGHLLRHVERALVPLEEAQAQPRFPHRYLDRHEVGLHRRQDLVCPPSGPLGGVGVGVGAAIVGVVAAGGREVVRLGGLGLGLGLG